MSYFAKIESLDFFGNGICHYEGKCCFIKNALPHEEVYFELTEEKKKYAKGEVTEIYQPSFFRRAPACFHYGECGGCDFQHVAYEKEAEAKEKHVFRMLTQIGGCEDFQFLPLERPEKSYNYRNNVTFHMKEGKTCLYRQKTHDHIMVDHCDLLEPQLNTALRIINSLNLTDATSVVLRCDNQYHLIAVIYGNCKNDFSAILKQYPIFTGIILINEKGKKVFGDENLIFSFDGMKFTVSYQSFFQVNTEAALNMLRYCVTLLILRSHKNILDLYCGVGSIGQYLSGNKNVYGIEIVKEAVALAKKNMEKNGLKGKYVCGKTEQKLKSLLKEVPQCDLVVLDPPRQGLQKDTAEVVANYGADTILYISCDPASLSRDLKVLQKNYKLISAKPFDLFPRTAHIETVCHLQK